MLNKILVDKAKDGHKIRSERFKSEIDNSISKSVIYDFRKGSEYELGFYGHSGMVQRSFDYRIDQWLKERLQFYSGKTCVLSDADPINPGGLYLEGICSFEEDLCYSTTLYEVLLGSAEYYKRNQSDPLSTIGADICLYTPDIIVTDDEYNQIGKIDVISCVPPNYADVVRDTARAEICTRNRVILILHIAALNGVDNLVIGNWQNDSFSHNLSRPESLFRDLAEMYSHYLSNVIYLEYR